MSSYEELLEKYKKLQDEFENYQSFAESTIQNLNEKNNSLEKRLDSLTNIIEVSKYINSYLSDDNLIPMINDMIIGILGVSYSSIYIKDEERLIVKAANFDSDKSNFYNEEYFCELENGKPFIMNSKEALFKMETEKEDIHSVIGVPITLRDRFIGYIVVEHTLCDFFNYDHIKFISSIANQIGIALENNSLYTKVKEASIRDPLLKIYNRRYFFDYVENYINKNPNRHFAIVMVDFDNFKMINDVYGHQAGDEVLIQTVKLIENSVNDCDMVARYGGEEIVIFINCYETNTEIFDRIDKIRIKISNNRIQLGNKYKNITASFGLSYYPYNGNSLQQVISVADVMLYQAKKAGKNIVVSSK